jgi:hypothetical protein
MNSTAGRVKSVLSTVSLNALVLLALLGALFISPPVIHWAYVQLTGEPEEGPLGGQAIARLPNYADYPWVEKHFEEFYSLRAEYRDYVTWRRKDFSGETITIQDGLRRTVSTSTPIEGSAEFHFFGGSTTWGTGVTDATTYPSIFSSVARRPAVNHGESGYVARQELSALVNFYVTAPDDRKRVIVFYDGVNDARERCRAEVSTLGTSREPQIRAAMANADTPSDPYSWSETFGQIRTLIGAFIGTSSEPSDAASGEGLFDCADNPDRAREIAQTLVTEWLAARDLARAHGDEFVAILQPVSFYSSPSLDHLPNLERDNPGVRAQYAAVYPEILRAAGAQSDLNFFDFTDAYDGSEPLYIDYCHVSPQAHEKLVRRMVLSFKQSGIL